MQLVARDLAKVELAGSSPVYRSKVNGGLLTDVSKPSFYFFYSIVHMSRSALMDYANDDGKRNA